MAAQDLCEGLYIEQPPLVPQLASIFEGLVLCTQLSLSNELTVLYISSCGNKMILLPYMSLPCFCFSSFAINSDKVDTKDKLRTALQLQGHSSTSGELQ
jgi:hypothetical protein